MRWVEKGFILGKRRHGETSVILDGWTRERGRVAGLVRGGNSRSLCGVIQTGNSVIFNWNGRLAEHLGTFTLEPDGFSSASLMSNPLALAGISITSELARLLPDGDAHPLLFDSYERLHASIHAGIFWFPDIVRYELIALQEMGFGLDLASCVATGAKEDLIYVSPRSGCAVSRKAGEPYREHLLPLPAFLLDHSITPRDSRSLLDGLRLTLFFLNRNVYQPRNFSSPYMRQFLIKHLSSL